MIKDLIILNNPEDIGGITSKHLKKMPNLKQYLYDSIISTTNEKWRDQRLNYVDHLIFMIV